MMPFEAALRDELSRVARRSPRRRAPKLAAAVAVVTAAAVGLLTLINTGTASADVKITRERGRIEILLTDVESSADEIEAALRAEGLDIDVEAVPTGPSNVGRFVGESASTDGLDDLRRIDETGASFLGFSIPDDWHGALTIRVGAVARSGEAYRAFSDALAQGEPLACASAYGAALSVVADSLPEVDIAVQPFEDGAASAVLTLDEALSRGFGDWYVTGGVAFSSDSLSIDVQPDPPTATRPPQC